MSPLDPRLKRYAAFLVVHALVVVAALAGVFGESGGLVVLVASVPWVWAYGAFQAHRALNPGLDEEERGRWRIALFLLPWAMAWYWHRHVRA